MTTRHDLSERHRRHAGPPALSRRDFLKGVSAVTAGLLVAGCQGGLPALFTTPSAAVAKVAIAQAQDYDRKLMQRQVQTMLDGIGGLRDVVSSGDRVAIKTNLTGGMNFRPPAGFTAIESYLTHPEVVRALGESLRDAGAREIFIVEAVYDKESYPTFGYEEVAQYLGASLIDLNLPDPYSDFAAAPVGDGSYVYKDFTFNHILEDVDAFVSIAKMKCHYNAGVTHSMKNLVGLVPAARYALSRDHWWRSALHGQDSETRQRLPRVIVDLNRARPIHLALIDGIKTGEAGEVPRETNAFKAVHPGLLFLGKNAVATDAVATAAMGFEPTAEYPAVPFHRSDNYLNLARELGLGTNRLDEIEVVGPAIQDIRYEFNPA
jgi:uncharacterized protein (DUF362 family)